jgi:hypothetical protein
MWRTLLVGAMLAGAPSYSLACSCFGTATIGEALSNADNVIVGRVLSPDPAVFEGGASRPSGVEIEVVKALKGDLKGSIFVATAMMCYQTFDATYFKPGETYVLPLHPPWDWEGGGDVVVSVYPSPSTEPRGRWFMLPGCSHSALALIEGRLYTNDGWVGEGRHLKYYMSLSMLERLLPLGVLRPIPTPVLVLLAIVVPIGILWWRRVRERKARLEAR